MPPRKATPEELAEAYLIATHKATKHALEAVVVKLIRGELQGLSKSWAPSPAELSSAIRDEMAHVQKLIDIATERAQIEDHRPTVVRAPNYEERAEAVRQKMIDEGRSVVFTVTSHDDFLRRRNQLPAGGVYQAILGAAYGPPGWQPPPAPVVDEMETEPLAEVQW